jgi:hypothetical protein
MAFRCGSKTKKWQIMAKPTWHHFGRKINWFTQEKKKKRAHDLEDQDVSEGPSQGTTPGFNFLQMTPNGSLGINLDPGPPI